MESLKTTTMIVMIVVGFYDCFCALVGCGLGAYIGGELKP